MKQRIYAFHKDNEGHWVVDLECGHQQHFRHDPPWMERPWILSEEGRRQRIGMEVNCKRCDEMGRTILQAAIEAADEAYHQGGLSGLCHEGRWELAREAIRNLDLEKELRKRQDTDHLFLSKTDSSD